MFKYAIREMVQDMKNALKSVFRFLKSITIILVALVMVLSLLASVVEFLFDFVNMFRGFPYVFDYSNFIGALVIILFTNFMLYGWYSIAKERSIERNFKESFKWIDTPNGSKGYNHIYTIVLNDYSSKTITRFDLYCNNDLEKPIHGFSLALNNMTKIRTIDYAYTDWKKKNV